jgi:hypothetical protein
MSQLLLKIKISVDIVLTNWKLDLKHLVSLLVDTVVRIVNSTHHILDNTCVEFVAQQENTWNCRHDNKLRIAMIALHAVFTERYLHGYSGVIPPARLVLIRGMIEMDLTTGAPAQKIGILGTPQTGNTRSPMLLRILNRVPQTLDLANEGYHTGAQSLAA